MSFLERFFVELYLQIAKFGRLQLVVGLPHHMVCVFQVPLSLELPGLYLLSPHLSLELVQFAASGQVWLKNPLVRLRGIQLFLGFRMQKLRWKHLLVSTLVFLALLLEWKTLKIRLFLRFFSHNILLIIINCCPPIILLLLLALQLLRFWFNYHPCMIPRFRFSQPALLQEGKFAFELGFAVISGDGDPDIFVRILQQGLDEGYVFLLDLFIDPWLVLFGHRSDYLVNVVSILLHFLVVAATLVGVSSYNHITNHFVNPCKFFLFRVLKQVPEEPQKDSILEAFLLIPMPVSLVFAKSAERRLNDPEGQMLRN